MYRARLVVIIAHRDKLVEYLARDEPVDVGVFVICGDRERQPVAEHLRLRAVTRDSSLLFRREAHLHARRDDALARGDESRLHLVGHQVIAPVVDLGGGQHDLPHWSRAVWNMTVGRGQHHVRDRVYRVAADDRIAVQRVLKRLRLDRREYPAEFIVAEFTLDHAVALSRGELFVLLIGIRILGRFEVRLYHAEVFGSEHQPRVNALFRLYARGVEFRLEPGYLTEPREVRENFLHLYILLCVPSPGRLSAEISLSK